MRGDLGFFGPRVAFRYRFRFASRAKPNSHLAMSPTDHVLITDHVSVATTIYNPGHAPDTSNAMW